MSRASAAAWPGRRARLGWVLYDFAQQPLFTLVTTFIFAPYFAAVVAGDPVRGQSLWAIGVAVAGIAIACLSPVLGAIADAAGRRKRWLLGFALVQIVGSAALWWATPGAVGIAIAAYVLAIVSAEFGIVFTNAMMPDLAPPERLGRLSGTGWAVGYLGGLLSLALVLVFVAGGETGRTLAGLAPILGLDVVPYGGERFTGPLTAVWFALFTLPFFLWTPDQSTPRPLRSAVVDGLARLAKTVHRARTIRPVLVFLLARMLYADGLAALFAFGGIYAAGVFGWGTTEQGLFGILLTVTGTLGAFLGGRLDDRFGPRPVIAGALVMLILASLAVTGLAPDRAFGIGLAPGEGLFAGTGDRLYLLATVFIGLAAGPVQSASRTLLVRLSPPDAMTEFFGLYALSGRATSFAAPLLIAASTAVFASQRAAVIVVIGFLVLGLALLVFVREEAAPHLSAESGAYR